MINAHGRKGCTSGSGVCDSCRGQVVPLDDGYYVRIAELVYCPFALDYTQEQLLIEMFNEDQRDRMHLPRGEWPIWLQQGIDYIADWLERNRKDK